MSSRKVIEDLKKIPKIGEKAANALMKAGFNVKRLSTANPAEISRILGCSLREAKLVINGARETFQGLVKPPLTANQYQEILDKEIMLYKTDVNALDELLGGGFKSSSTAGLVGPQATGKTQICNHMLIQVTCKYGRDGVFIETELNTFSNPRLRQIAAARGYKYDPSKVLVVPARRIRDVGMQFYQYEKVYEIAEAKGMDVGIIIVDSFTALFQRKYTGRELLPDRKQELGRHLSYLEDLAKEWNALLLCTCQVIECPVSPMEARGMMSSKDVRVQFGTNYMVWGGHILRHTLGTWLSLVKVEKDIWKAILFDSSEVPSGECYFRITEKGIEDVKKKEIR